MEKNNLCILLKAIGKKKKETWINPCWEILPVF